MVELPLYGKYGNGKCALIDDDLFEMLGVRHWMVTSKGYVVSYVQLGHQKQKMISMHRIVLGEPKSFIDHKDGNKLDNRRANLRECTNGQNQWNSKIPINNTSGYKGVYHIKSTGKYFAHIAVNGYKKYLGTFNTAIEAAKAYDEAAIAFHGEFAKLNV